MIGFTFCYKIDIKNCEVKSTDGNRNKIGIYASRDDLCSIGGLIGFAESGKGSINVNIINSKVSGIEIFDVTSSAEGGVIGYFRGNTVRLDGVELDDMLFTLYSSLNERGNSTKAGFIGMVDGDSYITNSKFTNSSMDIITCGPTAGIIGTSTGINNISGLEIDNLKIIEKSYTNCTNNETMGGIVGCAQNVTITDSKINNLEIELKYSNSSSIGALIGYTQDCIVSDITMNNIKMNCNDLGYKSNRTAFSIGGVVGVCTDNQITNVNIDGLGINTNVANIGGLVGYSYGDSIISGCSVINAVFESTESLTYASENIPANYAGLVATQTKNLSISDSSVENLEISIEQGALAHAAGFVGVCGNTNISSGNTNISNGTVNNLQIRNNSHYGIIGGIVGVFSNYYLNGLNQFTNVSVSDFHANVSTNGIASNSIRIGGILGCGISTIQNAKVTNMSTETATDGDIAVGGIAGIAVEGSVLDTVAVNSTEDKQDEAILYSSYGVSGGIAGVCSGKISNATVENITVQTKREISIPEADPDEISEEAKDSTEEQIVYLTNPYCAAIAAQYLEEFTNCIIRNVKVIYSNSTEIVNFE